VAHRRKKAFSLVELVLALIIVGTLVVTFSGYAYIALKVAREKALQQELMNIRMSLEHYQLIYGELPVRLPELMNKSLTKRSSDGKIFYERFLEFNRINAAGQLLDPFMHPYRYDPQKGLIYSEVLGYERW